MVLSCQQLVHGPHSQTPFPHTASRYEPPFPPRALILFPAKVSEQGETRGIVPAERTRA